MSQVEQAISELQSEDRTTLYLNEEGIKRAYNRIGEGDQLTLSNQLSRGGELGILGFFKGQLQNTTGHQTLIQMSDSPELMAIMVETHFRISGQLLELPDEEFRRDAPLIRYVGGSHITEDDQDVTAETTGLSGDALAQVVKKERNDQQDEMKKWADDPRMFVWAAAGEPNLASIALRRWAEPYGSYWASRYHRQNPKGILGRFESENNIVFITPLWIWHVTYIT